MNKLKSDETPISKIQCKKDKFCPTGYYKAFYKGHEYTVHDIIMNGTYWKIEDDHGNIHKLANDDVTSHFISELSHAAVIKSFQFEIAGYFKNVDTDCNEKIGSVIYFYVDNIYEYKIIEMNHVQLFNKDHTITIILPFEVFDKYFKIINEEE